MCSSFPVRDAMGPSPEPSWGNVWLLGDIDVLITLSLDREKSQRWPQEASRGLPTSLNSIFMEAGI